MSRWRDTWPYTWRDAGRFLAVYVVLTAAFVAMGWPLRDNGDNAVQRRDERVSEWMVEHRGSTVNGLTWLGSALATVNPVANLGRSIADVRERAVSGEAAQVTLQRIAERLPSRFSTT